MSSSASLCVCVNGFSTTTDPSQHSGLVLGLCVPTVLSMLQRQFCQFEVAARPSRHHHHIHFRIFDHLFTGPVAFHAGVVFLRIVVRFGASLDDGVECEFGYGCDQRDVENFCGEAVPNNGDVVGFGRHCSTIWFSEEVEGRFGSIPVNDSVETTLS